MDRPKIVMGFIYDEEKGYLTLEEHDKQKRVDVIDECIEALGNNIWDIAKLEQLKEQNE